eukprot:JP438771.1.p1 GENE.JP438771.1~~JP438771.1.p1  ORF type:complete len:123 (+),score=14.35 JP438771.1:27-371(+)
MAGLGSVREMGKFVPSSRELYKSLLRICKHAASKHKDLRYDKLVGIVRGRFQEHKDETDPDKLRELKNTAYTALSNYLLFLSKNQLKEETGKELFEATSERMRAQSFNFPKKGL